MSTALTFHVPARSSVEQCIAALQKLAPDIAAHLEQKQLLEAKATMLFAYWAHRMHKPHALLDSKRLKRLLARLEENAGDVSELLYAVDGAARDGWLMGTSERSERAYNGVETVFRDRAQVERLAEADLKYQAGVTHPLATKYGL